MGSGTCSPPCPRSSLREPLVSANVQTGAAHVVVCTKTIVVVDLRQLKGVLTEEYLHLNGRRHVVGQHLELLVPHWVEVLVDDVALVDNPLLVLELDIRIGAA